MKYALIERMIVTQVWEENPSLHPDFLVVEAPNGAEPGWPYLDGKVVAPSPPAISDLKMARINELTANCAAAIVGGYSSSALGSPHTYPSGVTDQINMMGSVTASLLPDLSSNWTTPFWCADSNGEWAFRAHRAVEIQKAGADGKAHVVSCQEKLSALSSAVSNAGGQTDILAISWQGE